MLQFNNENESNDQKRTFTLANKLAERISRQLFTHNWSLKMLSDKSGVPYETLKKISNAKIENPSLRSAVKIAAAFGCSLDYLSGFSDSEKINKHTPESDSYLNSLR